MVSVYAEQEAGEFVTANDLVDCDIFSVPLHLSLSSCELASVAICSNLQPCAAEVSISDDGEGMKFNDYQYVVLVLQ